MTNDNDARGALTEAVERTIETIERQLSLIGERAPGEYLDKRPVVQSLQAHVRRLRTALAAQLPAGDGLTDEQVEEFVCPLIQEHLSGYARHYVTYNDGQRNDRVTSDMRNLTRAILAAGGKK